MYKHITKFESNQLVVSRDDGLASLRIIIKLSQSFIDNMDDSTPNPLIDFANNFQEKLDTGRLCLTLVGHDNVITFLDNNAPILEGGVYLSNVQLNNPFLRDCKLTDVDLQNTEDLTMHFCKVNGLFMETTEVIHMVCCYIDDKHGLEDTKSPLRYLMNKHPKVR